MVSGCRPTHPNCPEISDCVWETIEGCWRTGPTKRKKNTEVVAVFEAEESALKNRNGIRSSVNLTLAFPFLHFYDPVPIF